MCVLCVVGDKERKVLVVVVEAKPKSFLVPHAARRLGPAASPLPALPVSQDTRPGPQGSPSSTPDTRIQGDGAWGGREQEDA